MTRTRSRTLAAAALAAALAAGPARAAADEALRWNRVAADAAAAANTDPLTESRTFAILHAAIHDAMNAVEPRYETFLPRPRRAAGASVEAAAASAAHAVLAELMPFARAAADAALEEALRAVPEGAARERGVEAGRAVARAVLAVRERDGAERRVAYAPGSRPGEYRPTPPDLTPAAFAHWGRVKPFVLASASQFRPPAPPAPGSAAARREVEEVRRIGGEGSASRSPEQSEIARYWYEDSTEGWNRIARELASARELGPFESARLLALVNLAMADGFIAGFEAKYHYRFWRPVTAIREAGDAGWLAFIASPPVPDHPSTHTVLGAAAATVMARALGTDHVSFAMTSGAPFPGITRRFTSLSAAARENGASRVLAGIHFPSAVRDGYAQGEQVGTWVVEHALRPLPAARLTASAR
jgi:hypothetical protein